MKEQCCACVLPNLMQATNAKATRKQEKVLLPKSLFVPDDQVRGYLYSTLQRIMHVCVCVCGCVHV